MYSKDCSVWLDVLSIIIYRLQNKDSLAITDEEEMENLTESLTSLSCFQDVQKEGYVIAMKQKKIGLYQMIKAVKIQLECKLRLCSVLLVYYSLSASLRVFDQCISALLSCMCVLFKQSLFVGRLSAVISENKRT